LNGVSMWPHQQQTFSRFSSADVGFDFSDPGTGKTLANLAVYNARKDRKRCLVLCPKTLMTSAWANEIKRYFPHLSYSLATAEKRLKAFEQKTDIVIMNIDGVTSVAKNKALLKKIEAEFDHLIVDECTAYKHRGSQRSKAAVKLSRLFRHRYLLSGSPNPNSVTELWNQALILDGGERLGTNFFKFRNAVQTPTQVGPQPNHLRWDDREGVDLEVYSLIGDVTVRHAFEEVMTHVPPNHKDHKAFALPPKLMAQYKELEKTSILQLESEVSAVHAAALRNKLLQLCSGAVYHGEDQYTVLDRTRYELICDLIDERDHSVVFFNWKHQRDELCKELEKRGKYFAVIDGNTPQKDRDEIVDLYQQGQFDTLLLHPRTGAHGLTLTRGTTCILSSPIYEADLLKQAIHRIYRGAQDQVTNTILISAEGTVEEYVYQRLDDKTARMDSFLDLVRTARDNRD
jgi:SNF2 family DNA or RNA helicase